MRRACSWIWKTVCTSSTAQTSFYTPSAISHKRHPTTSSVCFNIARLCFISVPNYTSTELNVSVSQARSSRAVLQQLQYHSLIGIAFFLLPADRRLEEARSANGELASMNNGLALQLRNQWLPITKKGIVLKATICLIFQFFSSLQITCVCWPFFSFFLFPSLSRAQLTISADVQNGKGSKRDVYKSLDIRTGHNRQKHPPLLQPNVCDCSVR